MAVGDTSDMAARIRAVLPVSWFPISPPGGPSATPILDGVLVGLGAAWATIYSLLSYVKLQTRIATATDFFLDLIAADFFADTLTRKEAEADNAFRIRLKNNIFAPRATRSALVEVLTDLTGRTPAIFEPAYADDTGGYGTPSQGGGGMGYGTIGGYGSLELPFQCFVTAFLPSAGGISLVAGYAGVVPPLFAPGALSARRSAATYLDQNGSMREAEAGEVRPQYSGTELIGLLLEPTGTNLIPASLDFATDWSTWGAPALITPSSTVPPLFEGATIMEFAPAPTAAGGYWSLDSLPTNTPYVSSVWVYLPAGFSAAVCLLDVNNGGSLNETQVAIDQSITGCWQRVSLLFDGQGSSTYTGFQVSGANLPACICCWQLEPGNTATSYIPTATGAASRDADFLSNILSGAGGYGGGAIEFADLGMAAGQVTDDEIYAAIAAVLPAATIAWTQISN